MKYTLLAGSMAVGLLGLTATAQAADLGVGVKAGLLGLGAEVTVGMSETFNGRLGFNSYTYKTSGTESDIRYDIDMKWQSTALLLDWHPGGGNFRLTAGYMLNGNRLDMTSKAGQATYNIGGVDYTGDITLNGRVTFRDAPYVGLGWGNAAKGKGFGFSVEAGAMYQNSPKVRLRCSGTDCAPLLGSLAEEERSLEADLDSYKWYPQIAVGVSYSF